MSATEERAAFALLAFGASRVTRLSVSSDLVALTTCLREQIALRNGKGLILHGLRALSRDGDAVDASGMRSRFEQYGDDCFDDFEPPLLAFALASTEAIVTSDRIGLSHLFMRQEDNCAVVSTSATLIAKIFNCPFSIDGIYQHMTVGHRLGAATAFDGVQLVPAGMRVKLSQGKHSFVGSARCEAGQAHGTIKAGCDAVTGAISRCLQAQPDCAIELSGGIDSRMVLAAIPDHLRPGRPAYTIGHEGVPDVEVARTLAQRCGLKHIFVNLARFSGEDIDTTWMRARRVAYRDDFATNVLDRLTIDCVDDVLLNCARIGGVNGELARGFYYAAMPIKGPVGNDSIDRLISWRLTTNDAAPRELFERGAQVCCASNLRELVGTALREGPHPLGNSLDHFYLRQRMRHWAGGAITRAQCDRLVLVPFFHSEFISWAMRLPVMRKKDSIAFSEVLTALDPELAGIALDSMLIPSAFSRASAEAKFALFINKCKKVVKKISNRIIKTSRSNIIEGTIQKNICQPEAIEQLNWNGLSSIGLFDQGGLNQLRDGTLPWNRVTMGVLFALSFQLEYLAQTPNSDQVAVVDFSERSADQ